MQTATSIGKLNLRYIKDKMYHRHVYIEQLYGKAVVNYITSHLNLEDPGVQIYNTNEPLNIKMNYASSLYGYVNLKEVNEIDNLNNFFEMVNENLPPGGYYIGCVQTNKSRRRKIFDEKSAILAYPLYCFDFLVKRLLPKLNIFRFVSEKLPCNPGRAMSCTETLGRLVSCGFEVIDHREIGYRTYFVCKKSGRPSYNGHKKYGMIIGLERVGKNGNIINVLKLRTMHPYAEYLQEYVSNANGLLYGDKVKDDFRVTSLGRLLRKYWLDEQPMWVNFFRGDIKLVGVRPLSQAKLSIYPKDLQARRKNYKPGLIPPYYAELPKTDEEFFACEEKYMDQYDNQPTLTDLRYFFGVLFNIFFRGVRSS